MVKKQDIQDKDVIPVVKNILEKTGDRVYSICDKQLRLFEIELQEDEENVDESKKDTPAKTKLLRE